MILSLGACRLVPRSLDTQLPLPFKRRRFSFELFQSAKRQRNAIWLERREDQPFDLGVHSQALDLLTARTSIFPDLDLAAIDRLITAPMIVGRHVASTGAAQNNPLQQGSPLTRHTRFALIVVILISCQTLPVGHELLPRDVSRIDILQAHFPRVNRQSHRTAMSHARASARRINFPMTINVGARVGRVLKNTAHVACVRRDPDGVVRRGASEQADWNLQSFAIEIAHDGSGAAQFAELVKDQPQTRLYFLVRMKCDFTSA